MFLYILLVDLKSSGSSGRVLGELWESSGRAPGALGAPGPEGSGRVLGAPGALGEFWESSGRALGFE